MLFKNNYHKSKSALLSIILLLLSTAIWNQAYLESQNFLFKNPNWYSYRSKFVDTFATTFSIAMGRIALSSHELNMRTSKHSDMILNRHQSVLKELEFDFRIMNNSHLDILYNFKDGASSFFRLSRSSLHETGMYQINVPGIYTKFKKVDFTIDSESKHRGRLQQTGEGIVLSVDDKIVAVSKGDKFENLEFGFETGVVGVIISNIKAIDANGALIGTYLDNNSGWFKYYLKNLILEIIVLLIIFIVYFFFKKNGTKAVLSSLQFLTLAGALWLVYDFYYYTKKETYWDREFSTTRFYTTPKDSIDFEVVRWKVFSFWARILGDRPIHQDDYNKRYGAFFSNYPLDYCLNSKCISLEEKDKIKSIRTQKKVIRLGMIGLSAHTSTGIRAYETSSFLEMHKEFFEKNKDYLDVESYNFSKPSVRLRENGESLLKDVTKNKIDVLVILLRIRHNTGQAELKAFGDLIKKCKEYGIKTLYINDPYNPENIVYFTSKQVQSTLKVNRLNHAAHNKIMYPIYASYLKYDLTIAEPDEVFFDLKNIKAGKIWWDYSHLTSYGHTLFGKWLAKKIELVVGKK
jgi:hypothetical protein